MPYQLTELLQSIEELWGQVFCKFTETTTADLVNPEIQDVSGKEHMPSHLLFSASENH